MIDDLRDYLMAADYTVDTVLARLGEAAQAGLGRNSTIPARIALGDDRSPLATLIRLFPLATSVSREDAEAALPLAALIEAGLLTTDGDQLRATVDLRPYGFETPDGQWDGWVVADHTPGLDHDRRPPRPDYVLGVSPASTTLAQMTIPDPVVSALDLGTGSGVQSLHLSTHAKQITATDVNPRCLQMARLTAELNRLDVDLRAGSLYEPVTDEKFDLIVSNPPHVMSPPNTQDRLIYRETAFTGDELVHQLVSESLNHLNLGGTCQLLANWAITHEPVEDRLARWAPSGADLWVIERELLDPYEYVELWLTDAGLAGDPSWPQRYREWLDYFEHLGIRAVGMGWFTVVNTQRDQPEFSYEKWPHEVAQPVGAALGARRHGVDLANRSDAELLTSHLRLRGDIVQETFGAPGSADPQHVLLRQSGGLKRVLEVDTVLGGVLGACDGELPLGTIIDAVAQLVGDDSAALRSKLLPSIRAAIRDDYLSTMTMD